MELVQDFMPVLVICKFEEGPIKTEGDMVSTTFFRCSRAGNSEVNGRPWPELELVRDSMTVLVICKFDDDQGQVTPKSMDGCGRNSNSSEMLVKVALAICKFDDDMIKNEGAIVSTTFSLL